MFRDEQISYGVLCAAAIGFFFVVIPAQIEVPAGVTVSPRLVPQACTILVFCLALYKLVSTMNLANGEYLISKLNYLYLLLVLALLGMTSFAMHWLGFWVSAAGSIVALQLIAGQRNPLIIITYAASLVGLSWYLLDLAGLYILTP